MAHLLLYGGTFDPIHHGHLIVSRAAREAVHADGVLLLPAWLSPHKQGDPPAATGTQRLHMIELAIKGQPDFAVDGRELARAGPSFTFDTIQDLHRSRPGDRFTLLIGADQLPKLHTWHKIEALLTQVPVAVMARPTADAAGLAIAHRHLDRLVDRLALLPTPLIDISATLIRQRAGQGLSISFLVPAPVAAYIARQKLYRPPQKAKRRKRGATV